MGAEFAQNSDSTDWQLIIGNIVGLLKFKVLKNFGNFLSQGPLSQKLTSVKVSYKSVQGGFF